MASRVINMTIPDELLRQVDAVAESEGFTRSELLRQAARHFLAGCAVRRKGAKPLLGRLAKMAVKGPKLSADELDGRIYGGKRS
jgi:metal-responsive CopG/Arc/MetJ family transcriptional regulator